MFTLYIFLFGWFLIVISVIAAYKASGIWPVAMCYTGIAIQGLALMWACAYLFIGTARADEFIVANVAAHHWQQSDNLNQKNYGLGIENTYGDLIGAVGFYKNSLNAQSGYALAGYTPIHLKGINAGIIGGAITGYPIAPVVPAMGLLFSVEYKNILANIILVPTVKRYDAIGFAALQVGVKL